MQCEVCMGVQWEVCMGVNLYALTSSRPFNAQTEHTYRVSWFEPAVSLSIVIYIYICLPIDTRMAPKV